MNTYPHTKTLSVLIFVAFISVMVYMGALFRVDSAHASEVLVFANVSIEDGSMRPLALSLDVPYVNSKSEVKTDVKADVKAEAKSDTSVNTDIPVNISTSNDLNLYARSLEQEDRDVSKVEVENDHILVAYRQPAKFLGFIPVSVMANVKVDAQGNVSVDYPWYTILSFKDDTKLKEELHLKVAEILGDGSGIGTTMNGTTTIAFADLSARSRAKIVQALHVALKNNKGE